MRRNPDYVLRYIGDTPYLLVTACKGELPASGVRLNDSGAAIWQLLQGDMSEDQLIESCQLYFECEDQSEMDFVAKQTRSFLRDMMNKNLICDYPMGRMEKEIRSFDVTEEHFEDEISEAEIGRYKIGRLGLRIFGDKEVLPDNFELFKAENADCRAEQKIQLTLWPDDKEIGPSYLANRYDMDQAGFISAIGLTVLKARKGYVILFDELPVRWIFISKDGRFSEIVYYRKDDDTRHAIYEATRLAFFYFAGLNEHFILHSAVLLHNSRAVLFSAMSGVGKSTHAALWEKNFGSHICNGDLALLTMEEGEVVAYGMPWCGTSESCENGRWPLSTIVLLSRDKDNFIKELAYDEKVIHILNRLVSPNWTESQLDDMLTFVNDIAGPIDVFRLYCNMEDEAAKVCKKRVESEACQELLNLI